jgi:hypothetical protein
MGRPLLFDHPFAGSVELQAGGCLPANVAWRFRRPERWSTSSVLGPAVLGGMVRHLEVQPK